MSDWTTIAAGTLMVGLPGPGLDTGTERALRDLGPAGVILFGRNLDSPGQTRDLLARVRDLLPPPTLLALDQEGGRVSRLEPWIGVTPSAADLARSGEAAVTRFAEATGRGLKSLGFNIDFAPVVDLCLPDATNGIGNRSFGIDPERAAALAGAFLAGLQRTGVAGCLKHFPGLGPTSVDSHERLPTVHHDRQRLEREDLAPFRILGPTAASVMVGHGHYPALDPIPDRPATLSPTIVTDLLRDRIGYRGLVVTDDLLMGAVTELDENGDAAVSAIEAGCDLLLYCTDLDRAERAVAALASRAANDTAMAARLEEAARSVRTFAGAWPAASGDPDAWDVAREEFSRRTGTDWLA